MKIIRFRREYSDTWEIAFNQKHLFEKLNGETAEIIMPAKCLIIRLWRKVFPMKFKEIPISYEVIK